MEDFPSQYLPAPTVSFNGNTAGSTIRTQMESGRVRQRSRFTRETRLYSVNWEMSDFQYGLFQSFVLYQINRGADWFNIDLPVGGEGMRTVSARIVDGKYSGAHVPVMNWNVSAQLEVDDAGVWSEDLYFLMIELGGISEYEAAVAHFESYEYS